ncbi:MAG: hypothetical protein IJD22_05030, partial [Clostridia bacterium]|nr:hypothetical protein [Clostridia bacterium]
MSWYIFFGCSVLCLLAGAVLAFIRSKMKYKRGRILDPSKIFFAAIVVSAVLLFLPVYIDAFENSSCGFFETLLISVHNMIRLFIVDGEFDFVTSHLGDLPTWLAKAYSILFSALFVVAPLMTFGFVLSFFKNIGAYKKYMTNYASDAYIFSELNEKSIALAENLFKNAKRKRLFVFTDVFEREEEESYELVERAKEIGAICFKKDIITVDFTFHSKKSRLSFFTIGEDQSENISQSLKLIERLRYRENTHLYVFSTQVESELLLTNAFNALKEGEAKPKIKVRRVNEVQSLISRNLFENGYEKIFGSASDEGGSEKQILALVIGMGSHGTEMTKALAWFCQMDGYRVRINSYDSDLGAEDKFISHCPELMDKRLNGNFELEGEALYEIKIHPGVNVDTKSFEESILSLPRVTYVFVALGSDEKNIAVAVRLRSLFARAGIYPEIQSVVYNSDKKEALTDIANF